MSTESERRHGTLESVGLDIVRRHSQRYLAQGVALVILGLVAVALPSVATVATELLIGFVLIVSGIAQLFTSFSLRGWGGFLVALLAGVLYIVAGGLLLTYPLRGVLALTLVLGMFFLLAGGFKITMSFALRPLPHWGLVLASGVLSLFIALLILANWPSAAAWAIGLLVGVDLLFTGAAMVMVAAPAYREAHA
jgi:uncharacterized membrane protein HdeD (DUF308 family)